MKTLPPPSCRLPRTPSVTGMATLARGVGASTEAARPRRHPHGPTSRGQWFGLFDGHNVQWVQHVHETLTGRNHHALGGEKDKLAVRHGKLRSVRGPDLERHKPTLKPLTNVLYCHAGSVRSLHAPVKVRVSDHDRLTDIRFNFGIIATPDRLWRLDPHKDKPPCAP